MIDLLDQLLGKTLVSKMEGPHKFSCVMATIPGEAAEKIVAFGKQIPDEELAEGGREQNPHVTILYGLHTSNFEDVRPIFTSVSPIPMLLMQTKVFPATEKRQSDVVVVEILSGELRELNEKLRTLPYTNDYPEYRAHATVAYVKPSMGEKYAGRLIDNDVFFADTIEFSSADAERTFFKLAYRDFTDALDRILDIAKAAKTGGKWITYRGRRIYIGAGNMNGASKTKKIHGHLVTVRDTNPVHKLTTKLLKK